MARKQAAVAGDVAVRACRTPSALLQMGGPLITVGRNGVYSWPKSSRRRWGHLCQHLRKPESRRRSPTRVPPHAAPCQGGMITLMTQLSGYSRTWLMLDNPTVHDAAVICDHAQMVPFSDRLAAAPFSTLCHWQDLLENWRLAIADRSTNPLRTSSVSDSNEPGYEAAEEVPDHAAGANLCVRRCGECRRQSPQIVRRSMLPVR